MSNGTIVAMAAMGLGLAVVFYLAPTVLGEKGARAAIPRGRLVAFVASSFVVVTVAVILLTPLFFGGTITDRLVDPRCTPGMYIAGLCDDSYYPGGAPPSWRP